jgi:hypothetical protein
MHGQLKPESDNVMDRMREVGTGHPDYAGLKKEWTRLVDREWQRMSRILDREDKERFLSGCEVKVAGAVERMARDVS